MNMISLTLCFCCLIALWLLRDLVVGLINHVKYGRSNDYREALAKTSKSDSLDKCKIIFSTVSQVTVYFCEGINKRKTINLYKDDLYCDDGKTPYFDRYL